ncbi:MAG: hypothetical protein ACPF93_06465, partial [Poseidonia sp.]
MRSKAVFLVLIFFASLFGGFVQGQTPEDITVDGDYSDWSSDSLMATDSSGVDFRLTWNETMLFLGWDGTDWKSTFEGADLFVYLNTSEGGSVLARDWGFAHTLPFAADHGFVLEDDTYYQHIAYDGSSWTDQSTTIDLYAGWADNKATEFALPWSALGQPTSFDILVYAQWQDEGNVWASFPVQNPASNNGAETFTHAWHAENISNATAPQQLPIIESGGAEKVDDALNLAIVFHQHQPYYKNKLTGMYEMPWVRVHAMTEYVDSPGILADTDTKVTYNLVPSFIEQLVDYHVSETLDVHTDIAKRSWSEGGYPNATA